VTSTNANVALPEGIYSSGYEALVKRYGHSPDSMEQVMIVVDAALPRITAAERERIAQMAEQHKATYPLCERPGLIIDHLSFADLIRQGGPDA